jgi:hypothetical protein
MSAAHKPMPRNKMVIFKGAGAPSLQAAAMSTGRSHVDDEPIDTRLHEKDPARFRAKAEASLAEAVSPPTDAAREA